MKNLKRVLSLALTGVMLVGMMAIGASAANKDFTDADEIQHTEAVDVMSTLGVLKGKDTGAFDPSATVTRAEMAKIICVMLNGGVDPTLGSGSAAMFSDIANHWARKYIEYCASEGIIAGQGDGTFAPDAPVTGAAAAKMLLVALGYDSDIFKFTGMDWEINVNRIANTEAKLYEGIKSIDTSAGLSRDNTAQMAYNALESKLMETSYDKVVSSGEISYRYGLSEESFLNKYFSAHTWIGTFNGDHNTVKSGVPSGSIQVYGRLDTDIGKEDKNDSAATFPSEFDIANIGEEVKVIFKDSKSGAPNKPDKNDVIYGVFNTGKTTVYNITKNDLQDGDDAKGKIKFGGTEYELATDGKAFTIFTNYVETQSFDGETKGQEMSAAAKYIEDNLKVQSGDTIKLVANDDGEIYRAYVVATKLGRVTSATASKITISGIGSIEVEKNDVVEGLKVDDVVAFTRFYNDDEKDKAYFTVVKAEAVEGKISGYKSGDKGFTNVSIDGTTYKIVEETLVNTLTDDSMNTLKDEVGTEVKAYLANGMVVAVDKVEGGASSYALVIGGNGDDTNDKTMSEGRVRLLLSDGTKVTYTVDEDSKLQLKTDSVTAGTLVKYSVDAKNVVDLKAKVETKTNTDKVWNNDTKKVADTAVAESDAVLYVSTSKDGDYKVYNLRSLKTLSMTDDKDNAVKKDVYYVTNSSGKVTAAYVDYQNTPAGATSDTLYGMVIADNGVVKIDDTYYSQYVVWTGDETEVNIKGQDDPFNTGDYVVFDESNDKTYGTNDVVKLDTVAGKRTVTDAASKEYSAADKVLSYYVKLNLANKVYSGDKDNLKTAAMDKDAVIIYVNRDGKKAGDDAGIGLFDTSTGYANVKIVTDKEGVIVALFVETSGKCNVNGKKADEGRLPVVTPTCEHALVKVEAVAAKNCQDKGTKEHYKCSKCNALFADNDATKDPIKNAPEGDSFGAHTYEWEAVAADATEHAGEHKGTCKNSPCDSTVYHAADAAEDARGGCTLEHS